LTITYLDAAGSVQTACVNVDPTVATSAQGAFYRFGLVGTAGGIRQLQSYTQSVTWTSGAAALVLYRVIAALELPGNLIPNAIDALTSGFPEIWNGCVPFLIFIPNTTTAAYVSGTYTETQG
jgi:hypothetical protein